MPHKRSLPILKKAAAGCQGCELYKAATQTVFGEGNVSARILMVGEQPGNEEDLQGRPFVGPAGRLLDRALSEAGLSRTDIYLTNAVKHFKSEPSGKRRLHKKPNSKEVTACLPWLEAEIDLIKPEILILLGATAAQAVLGKNFKLTQHRGEIFSSSRAPHTMATMHPSAILRQPDSESREREMKMLVSDLQKAREMLANFSRP